jgi:hypothetical protein
LKEVSVVDYIVRVLFRITYVRGKGKEAWNEVNSASIEAARQDTRVANSCSMMDCATDRIIEMVMHFYVAAENRSLAIITGKEIFRNVIRSKLDKLENVEKVRMLKMWTAR